MTWGAVAAGATWVERHFTLDTKMWGSDQKASMEPDELEELVDGIREFEESYLYDYDDDSPHMTDAFVMDSAKCDRLVFEGEFAKMKTLRGDAWSGGSGSGGAASVKDGK